MPQVTSCNRCRWLEDDPTGLPRLSITTPTGTAEYTVEQVVGGYILTKFVPATFEIKVYRVANRQPVLVGRHYYVPKNIGAWACSCPDYTHRQRPCKHVKALMAALPRRPL